MQAIAVTVRKNAESAQQASTVAGKTCTVADRGGEIVGRAVGAMARIEDSSRKVADIIGVIDEIARQTNLLALNAAVEAARAGRIGPRFCRGGRGGAVAGTAFLPGSKRHQGAHQQFVGAGQGRRAARQPGGGSRSARSSESIKAGCGDRVGDCRRQRRAVERHREVNAALNQMDQVTQQNSALVEENAAARQVFGTAIAGDGKSRCGSSRSMLRSNPKLRIGLLPNEPTAVCFGAASVLLLKQGRWMLCCDGTKTQYRDSPGRPRRGGAVDRARQSHGNRGLSGRRVSSLSRFRRDAVQHALHRIYGGTARSKQAG